MELNVSGRNRELLLGRALLPGTVALALESSLPARLEPDGRLRLLSPASPFTLNDSFANVAKLARRAGASTVTLHPSDAAVRGLQEGHEALLSNDTGRLRLRVLLSEDFPPGVALSYKGRWPKQEPAVANVNALNPGRKSDMGENSCVHSVEVAVTRVT